MVYTTRKSFNKQQKDTIQSKDNEEEEVQYMEVMNCDKITPILPKKSNNKKSSEQEDLPNKRLRKVRNEKQNLKFLDHSDEEGASEESIDEGEYSSESEDLEFQTANNITDSDDEDDNQNRKLKKQKDLQQEFDYTSINKKKEVVDQLIQEIQNYTQMQIQNQNHKSNKGSKNQQSKTFHKLTEQPSILKNGKLKDFQLEGLNWMINLYEKNINGILADEMGLGKTIQAISLIAYLHEYKKISKKILIIAPLSTIDNWNREFQKWLPNIKVAIMPGKFEIREEVLQNIVLKNKCHVIIATYEALYRSLSDLSQIPFEYLIIDEGHKLKNEKSLIAQNVREIDSKNRLILSGTPLQNNMSELWSLLNFLMPELFQDKQLFNKWFINKQSKTENEDLIEEANLEQINSLHKVLKPFILRRTKDEVAKSIPPKKEIFLYVGLSKLQVECYKKILLQQQVGNASFFQNVLSALRQICDHPYLIDGVEDQDLPPLGEHLIKNSGKMVVLDKLLKKLINDNTRHQVLIFSQFLVQLDILEDYCLYNSFNYCRIDGATPYEDRDKQIQDFVRKDSDKFIFLISTRAGGLGINLNTADTVILYDSDFNPQVDLQAIDRAHRLGQVNNVNVYRLICENTVEVKIIERQLVKLKFDKFLITQGRADLIGQKKISKQEIQNWITHGFREIYKSNDGTITDTDIDELLARGQKLAENQKKEIDEAFQKKISNLSELEVQTIDMFQFNNEDFREKKKQDLQALQEYQKQIQLEQDMTLTRQYRQLNDVQISKESKKDSKNKSKQKLNLVQETLNYFDRNFPEYHLYDDRNRLKELFMKSVGFYYDRETSQFIKKKEKQKNKTENIIYDFDTRTFEVILDEPKQNNNNDKLSDSSANSLQETTCEQEDEDYKPKSGISQKELKEFQLIQKSGFVNWTEQNYLSYIDVKNKNVIDDIKLLEEALPDKSRNEIQQFEKKLIIDQYYKNIKYKKISLFKAIKFIEYEQNKNQIAELFQFVVKNSKTFQEIDLDLLEISRDKFFTSIRNQTHLGLQYKEILNDSHILFIMWGFSVYGDDWDIIHKLIKQEPSFRFDNFIKVFESKNLFKVVKLIYQRLVQLKINVLLQEHKDKILKEQIKKQKSDKKKQQKSQKKESIQNLSEQQNKNKSKRKSKTSKEQKNSNQQDIESSNSEASESDQDQVDENTQTIQQPDKNIDNNETKQQQKQKLEEIPQNRKQKNSKIQQNLTEENNNKQKKELKQQNLDNFYINIQNSKKRSNLQPLEVFKNSEGYGQNLESKQIKMSQD